MSASGRPDWRVATVVEAVDVTASARRLTLERPGANQRAEPGTHLDVRVPIGDSIRTRSYSVVESSANGSRITITVLQVRDSRGGSRYLHTLEVGSTLETTQPLQNFPLRTGAPRYLLLAGGIGITALVEAARVLHRIGADYRLVYVGRSRNLMAYVDELADMHGDRLAMHVDDEANPLDVPSLVGDVAAHDLSLATELYVCGPIRLMDEVRRCWADADLPVTNLRYETFGSSGWFDPQAFRVRIPRLSIDTTVDADQTMLEALAGAGADLMYDCHKGECGLCRVDVAEVSGRIDHRDVFLSQAQREQGRYVCACVSRVVATDEKEPSIVLNVP